MTKAKEAEERSSSGESSETAKQVESESLREIEEVTTPSEAGVALVGLGELNDEQTEELGFVKRLDAFPVFDFFVIYFVQMVSSMGAYGLLTMVFLKPDKAGKLGMALGVTLIGSLVAMGLIVQRGRWLHEIPWRQMGWKLPSLREAGISALIFFPSVLLFTNLYVYVMKWLFALPKPKQQVAQLFAPEMPFWLQAMALVLVVLTAPLMEEMLYRGVLAHSLESHLSGHWAALVSGLIFGIAHLEPQTILPLAFLGYVLAIIFQRTRSLPLLIGLHCLNNMVAFVSLFFVEGV